MDETKEHSGTEDAQAPLERSSYSSDETIGQSEGEGSQPPTQRHRCFNFVFSTRFQ